jgi:hypothetical protein
MHLVKLVPARFPAGVHRVSGLTAVDIFVQSGVLQRNF